jgi:peptide/nickel transport system substrate-binding protein
LKSGSTSNQRKPTKESAKSWLWEGERKLAEDGARPIIFYNRFAYCWQPQVKGWTVMADSIINNWRMEDA